MFTPSLHSLLYLSLFCVPLFVLLRLALWLAFGWSSNKRALLGWWWCGCLLGVFVYLWFQTRLTIVQFSITSNNPLQAFATPTGEKRTNRYGITQIETLVSSSDKTKRRIWLSRSSVLNYLDTVPETKQASLKSIPIIHSKNKFSHILVGKLSEFNLSQELIRSSFGILCLLLIVLFECLSSRYLRQTVVLLRYLILKTRVRRAWAFFSLRRRIRSTPRAQRMLALLFAGLSRIGEATGNIRASEREAILEIGERRSLALSSREKVQVLRSVREMNVAAVSYLDVLNELVDKIRISRSLRAGFYEMLLSIALADLNISPEEQALLDQAAQKLKLSSRKTKKIRQQFEQILKLQTRLAEFGMPEPERREYQWQERIYAEAHGNKTEARKKNQNIFGNQSEIHSQAAEKPPAPYLVLGLQQGASLASIKAAYRRLALKYHPDRSAYSGIPREVANDRFRQVQEAYEQILEELQK